MFTELLHEMKDKHVSRRQIKRLNKKAAQTHANYLQHKVMYDALKDEVWDQQAASIELRQQLEEYEATIDYDAGTWEVIDYYQINCNCGGGGGGYWGGGGGGAGEGVCAGEIGAGCRRLRVPFWVHGCMS